jgi:hypothetical protein
MKEPVIVIGMHRSGTSMLTRVLQDAGLFMGNKKDENDEAWFFLNFNDWILKQTNSSWDNPYCYDYATEKFKQNIIRIYNKRKKSIFSMNYFGISKYVKYHNFDNIDFKWGWKDPRNTITLNIWKEIYPNAKILHIYRNPVDVAQSLKVRAQKQEENFSINFKTKIKEFLLFGKVSYADSYRIMHLEEGYKLWNEYVSKSIKEKNALHIGYEELLDKPEDNLKIIFEFLNIQISADKLKTFSSMFDKNRKYAFLKNKKLLEFYKKIKNDDLMVKLGYHNINEVL